MTVVLRRQVPIRPSEAPRSWIGGLPMMPEGVEWPRSVNAEQAREGSRPLHFVAQIACGDLPAELWGGRGPREGWLLFFLNNNASSTDGLHRVLHILSLGPERRPPEDIGPVHDGVYTGSSFKPYMDQADVPSVWRRWPVDLVAFPNELHRDGPRSFGTPPDFAAKLYAGQSVGAESDRAPRLEPFSWRCLESALKLLRAAASVPPAISRDEMRMRERLAEQGELTAILEALDAEEAEFAGREAGRLLAADPATLDESRRAQVERIRQRKEERLERRAKLAALIARYPDHAEMGDFLEAERMRRVQWRATAADRHAALLAEFGAGHPDRTLPPERWAEIRQALQEDTFSGWFPAYGHSRVMLIEERQETTWQFLASRVANGVPEIAADYYVDKARRHLVPNDAVALLEPWWRRLYANRPHRIGGYHDGVQSDADEKQTGPILLLQLATDDAMQWCWGDAGAIYWFIPAAALESGRFDKAECQIECH